MKRRQRAVPRLTELSLERLEPRLLLSAINAGEPSVLYSGDRLYFTQGDTPSDGEGSANTVVIATFEGPGYVEIWDSLDSQSGLGQPFLVNGSKIGDIYFHGVTEESSLYVQTGQFRTGFSLGDVEAPLADMGNHTQQTALTIIVPSGDLITYTTGRAVVAGVGLVTTGQPIGNDWYTFAGQEAERILVTPTAGAQIREIIVDHPFLGQIAFAGNDTGSALLDLDPVNDTMDALTVYVCVETSGVPYTLQVDRTELYRDPYNIVQTQEDLPPTLSLPMDISYNSGNQQGFGPRTPEFTLFGNGPLAPADPPNGDWFLFTLPAEATVLASDFFGVQAVYLADLNGNVFSDLVTDRQFYNYTGAALPVWMEVVSLSAWSFDLAMDPGELDVMATPAVVAAYGAYNTGPYDWWSSAVTPWMETFANAPATAPAGSGGAVITGNIHFDGASTGFGTLAIDGSLKGSIGMPGATLGPGETIHEIRVGYIHGVQFDFQGVTTGGLYIEGNVDRLLVQSTVAELTATNVMAGPDLGGSASIYVGGYLMEFQCSGTINADIFVGGNSTDQPVFDFDLRAYNGKADSALWPADPRDPRPPWPYPFPPDEYAELYSGRSDSGLSNDSPDAASVVGSPTGTFTIEGHIAPSGVFLVGDDVDAQDWHVFNAGLGQQVTVQVDEGLGAPVYIFAPSGRLVAVTAFGEEPAAFTADEGGNYYLMVGEVGDPALELFTAGSVDYRITVSGTAPVSLGGIVVGSNLFGTADTSATLEFADDMSDTYVSVGGSLGFIHVRGAGNYADANLTVSGDVGLISADNATSDDHDYPYFNIAGNLDKLEIRSGDFMFGDMSTPSSYSGYLTVGGNVGEIYVAGVLGQPALLRVSGSSFETPPIRVDGHVGSIIAGGDFYAELAVGMGIHRDGLDLLYVGGNFGALDAVSRLDMAAGADVAFAHVVGQIYYRDVTGVSTVLGPVFVDNWGHVFTDDGGSNLHLNPISTTTITTVTQAIYATKQGTVTVAETTTVEVPASLTYRYLPVGRPGGGPVGAVITEISGTDSIIIGIEEGRADVSFITLDSDGDTNGVFIGLSSPDPLAELDVYYVDAAAAAAGGAGPRISAIVNYTEQGDIVNVSAASVGLLHADGHIGLTERFAPEGGALPNPTPATFAPAAVAAVSVDQVLSAATSAGPVLTDDYALRFNGVLVAGDVSRIEANGSIGDIYVGGAIDTVRANADGTLNGTAFNFRGMHRDARSWDGIAGVVYATGDIGTLAVGSGIYGGTGGRPVGGVFAGGQISTITASNATIAGPIFAGAGIGFFTGHATRIEDTVIGAGAQFTDWSIWASSRLNVQSVRLESLILTGPGSGIESSIIEVGVLGSLYIGSLGDGFVSSNIMAMGDPVTGEGINSITILGGGMDNTEPLPFGGWVVGISTHQNIRSIGVWGGDVINMDIEAFDSIGSITARGPIVADMSSNIVGHQGIGSITAAAVAGGGNLRIGAARLDTLAVTLDVDADVEVDGPVGLLSIGGALIGDFGLIGPHGRVDTAVVGRGIGGDFSAFSYIGSVTVRSGDVVGTISAGGSNRDNVAIGSVTIANGDLIGGIATTAQLSALRPGGGIRSVFVAGDVLGDITATGYYDPVRGNSIPGNIGTVYVVGSVVGDVTTVQNDPLSPNDPGGDMGVLMVIGGELNGNVQVSGNVRQILVQGGAITPATAGQPLTVGTTTGNVGTIMVMAGPGVPAAIADTVTVDVGGNLSQILVSGADFEGDLDVDGTVGTLWLAPSVDMLGSVSAGAIDNANINGPAGLVAPVDVAGHIGRLIVPAGTGAGGTVTAGAGLDHLQTSGPVVGAVAVTGDVGTVSIVGADLSAALTVTDGNVDSLRIVGGQLTGDISVDGDVGVLQIVNPGLTAMQSSVTVGDHAGQVLIFGDVDGDISVGNDDLGDGIELLMLNGDVEGDVEIGGDVGRMLIVGGRITSNGNPDPRIRITGNAEQLQISGYAGAGAMIGDDILVGDALGYFLVADGAFAGSLHAGSMGTILFNTPDGLADQVTSDGELEQLIVSYGPIGATVDVFHHAGRIVARAGVSAGGQIAVNRSGAPGSGLDQLLVSGGSLSGDVNVAGNLQRIMVSANIEDSNITVTGGSLDEVLVTGSYLNSNIDAGSLGRVTVGGQVASTAPPHQIRARTGSFDLFAGGVFYHIDGSPGEMIDGVQAYVG